MAPSWPQVGPKSAPSRSQVGRKTLQKAPKPLLHSLWHRRRLEDPLRVRIKARLGPPRRPKIVLPPRRRANFVIFAPQRKTPPPEAQVGPKLGPSWPQVGPKSGPGAARRRPGGAPGARFRSQCRFERLFRAISRRVPRNAQKCSEMLPDTLPLYLNRYCVLLLFLPLGVRQGVRRV